MKLEFSSCQEETVHNIPPGMLFLLKGQYHVHSLFTLFLFVAKSSSMLNMDGGFGIARSPLQGK